MNDSGPRTSKNSNETTGKFQDMQCWKVTSQSLEDFFEFQFLLMKRK